MGSVGWDTICAGAISCSIATVLLQPLDVIKTRQQKPNSNNRRAISICKDLVKTEGFNGIFRGLFPALLRVIPSAGLYFWSLQQTQIHYPIIAQRSLGLFNPNSDSIPKCYDALTSGCCRAFPVLLFSPLLLIKTQLEASTSFQKPRGRTLNIIRNTFRIDGWRGFYKGCFATLLRDVPFSGIYFSMYVTILELFGYDRPLAFQTAKKGPERDRVTAGKIEENLLVLPLASDHLTPIEDTMTCPLLGMAGVMACTDAIPSIPFHLNFLASIMAGMFAVILTHPFDVIRTQMQLVPLNDQLACTTPLSNEKLKYIVNNAVTERKRLHTDTGSINEDRIQPRKKHLIRYSMDNVIPTTNHIIKPESLPKKPQSPNGFLQIIFDVYKFSGSDTFWRGLFPRLLRRTLVTALGWTMFEEITKNTVSSAATCKYSDEE